MSNQKEFECPKCGLVMKAIASQVSHRCPKNKLQYTNFEQKPERK